MFSNFHQKENNLQSDPKSSAKEKKKSKYQKYTPTRHQRSNGKNQGKLYTTMYKKTLAKKNENHASQEQLNEESISNHEEYFNQIKLQAINLTEEEILVSRQYKELEREYEEENKNHTKQIFRMNYFLEQKDSQTDTINTTIKQLKNQILELKYQFFALKMIEKEEDEDNYNLYKEMEEVVLKMKPKEQHEVEGEKPSYEIKVNEESQEEVYSESDS